jgi:hypothetical protein
MSWTRDQTGNGRGKQNNVKFENLTGKQNRELVQNEETK